MRLFAVAAALALVTPSFSYTKKYTVKGDTAYDDPHTSLKGVTCAYGERGVLTNGYTTYGSLPTFPRIGGAPQITSSHSPYCSSCWEITYTDVQGDSTSANITAIDAAWDHDEFIISSEALDALTNGRGGSLGSVTVTVIRLLDEACDLSFKDD